MSIFSTFEICIGCGQTGVSPRHRTWRRDVMQRSPKARAAGDFGSIATTCRVRHSIPRTDKVRWTRLSYSGWLVSSSRCEKPTSRNCPLDWDVHSAVRQGWPPGNRSNALHSLQPWHGPSSMLIADIRAAWGSGVCLNSQKLPDRRSDLAMVSSRPFKAWGHSDFLFWDPRDPRRHVWAGQKEARC